jgi:phosphatidylglycerophosphatase A
MTFARLAASGFGLGFLPVASGTAASALAVLLGIPLMLGPAWMLSVAAALASLGGLWLISSAQVEGDPGWVVIDEIAGQWIALVGLARPTIAGLIAAFAIFRLLDIAKPGPVRWADRQGGEAGIMGDDLIAGALTAGILWAIRSRWPGAFG